MNEIELQYAIMFKKMSNFETNHPLMAATTQELREMRSGEHYIEIPEDIDVVWILSGHGAADKTQETGTFTGRSMDRERIDTAIELVKEVTALRLHKVSNTITKEEIEQTGPQLFYNGEAFQNEAMQRYRDSEEFPLPPNKITIEPLKINNTKGQFLSFVDYANQLNKLRRVAIVTHAPHVPRSSRYLASIVPQLTSDTNFVFCPVPERHVASGSVLGEARRIETYVNKGDLPTNPYPETYIHMVNPPKNTPKR